MGLGGLFRRALLGLLGVALLACELTESAVVNPEPVLVAEIQLILDGDRPRWALAYLHATQGGEEELRLGGAEVEVQGPDGEAVRLISTSDIRCLDGDGVFHQVEGACFMAWEDELPELGPLDRVEATVRLPGGEELHGVARVPGRFHLQVPAAGSTLVVPPESTLQMQWTPSEDAWGYLVDARLTLPEALGHGQDLPREVTLLGMAGGAADTTFSFPDAAASIAPDGDTETLLGVVSGGLPHGSQADVAVGALDANLAGWLQGRDFHPSGQVRVPSLEGDGTGVFGVVRQQSAEVRVRNGGS